MSFYSVFRLGEIQGNHKELPQQEMYLSQKGNAISKRQFITYNLLIDK